MLFVGQNNARSKVKVSPSLVPLRMMSYEITAETRIRQVLQIYVDVLVDRLNVSTYTRLCVYSRFVFAHNI